MKSPFANGKGDSVELIIRSFPVFMANFRFFFLYLTDFSIFGISEWLLLTSSSGTGRFVGKECTGRKEEY